jgi:hypothetical protein
VFSGGSRYAGELYCILLEDNPDSGYCIPLLTRVNSTNVLDEGLRIRGRATTRDSGIEIGTRCTQVHVPAVEDRYILLAI